jgi:hypothetical protein
MDRTETLRVRDRSQKSDFWQEGQDLLYELKCAMLTFEAALPRGCMYDHPESRVLHMKLSREDLKAWTVKVRRATTATEVGMMMMIMMMMMSVMVLPVTVVMEVVVIG